MLNWDRIKRVSLILQERGYDALFIAPSADMEYVSEMKMRPDERLKALIILTNGEVFCIAPKLYKGEFDEYIRGEAPIYLWDDNDWFFSTLESAFKKHGIANGKIGINVGVRGVDAVEIQRRNNVELFAAEDVLAELRMIKDENELALMDRSGEICDTIMEELASFIQPGMTEKEIRRYIMRRYEELGADFNSWNPIVAAGANGAQGHYSKEAGVVAEQDVVLVDIGCGYRGYRSDITRTYFIGEPTQKQRDVFEAVFEAQAAAQALVAPGIPACEVHKIAVEYMTRAGFGHTFLTRTGHGVGRDGHELPYISAVNDRPLREGMCFSVEPSASFPGEFGIRIENTVTVTSQGAHSFNKCKVRL